VGKEKQAATLQQPDSSNFYSTTTTPTMALRHYYYYYPGRHNHVASILQRLVVILGLTMMRRTIGAETTSTSTSTTTKTTLIANAAPPVLVTCPSSPIVFCLELIDYSDMESDDICVCDVESGHSGAFECSRPGGGGDGGNGEVEDDDSLQVWCRGKVIGTCEFEIEEQEYIDAEKESDRNDFGMNAIESEEEPSSLSSSSTLGPPSQSGSSDTRNIGVKTFLTGSVLFVIGLAAMATVYQRQIHQIRHRRRMHYNATSTSSTMAEEEENEPPQSSTRSSSTNSTERNDNGVDDWDTGRTNATTTTTTTTVKSEVELALFEFV
jgi:hypothetical protein